VHRVEKRDGAREV